MGIVDFGEVRQMQTEGAALVAGLGAGLAGFDGLDGLDGLVIALATVVMMAVFEFWRVARVGSR